MLGHRDFRVYAFGHWFGAIGFWNFRIALGWLTWELTESGAWLGIVAFAEAFPGAVLLPFTGAIADRVHRLALFKFNQIINLGLMAAVAVLTLTGLITIHLLTVLVFLVGVNAAFGMPARMTLAPNLVPVADISPAVATNASLFTLSMFVGPAIAGFIVTHWGAGAGFVSAAAMTVVLIVTLYLLRLTHYRDAGARARGGFLEEVAEGVRHGFSHPKIAPLLVLVLLGSMLLRPYMDLLPGFADAVFGRGADGLSIFVSTAGLTALGGSFWLANSARTEGLTVKFLAGLGAAVFMFAMTDVFWLGVALVGLVSFSIVVMSISAQMMVQNTVEEAMRGRVMSLFGISVRGAPAVGALLMGTASSYLGLQWPVGIGALICLAMWAVTSRRIRRLAPELERIGP